MEVSDQLLAPVALSLKKQPPVTLIWRLGWSPRRLDAVEERKISSCSPQFLGRPALSLVATTTQLSLFTVVY
jgi:hypothetical protein